MVETVVIKEIHSNGEVFRIGDKVRLHMKRGFVLGLNPKNHKYVGTINSIYEDKIGMSYHNGQHDFPYLTRNIKLEDRPYNESGFFSSKDVELIERV